MKTHFTARKLPLFGIRKRLWPTASPMVNLASCFVWACRVLSPSTWLAAFFQIERDRKDFAHPSFTDWYQLIVTSIAAAGFMLSDLMPQNSLVLFIVVSVLVLDCLQYQLETIVLKPALNSEYMPYSATRTVCLFIAQYVHVTLLYAIVYLNWFANAFEVPLRKSSALEFSVGAMTSVGLGLNPHPDSLAALVASSQALAGILMLGLTISAAVSRTRATQQIPEGAVGRWACEEFVLNSLQRLSYLRRFHQVEKALREQVWIVGGWLRAGLMNDRRYAGDVDCLTTSTPIEVEKRLSEAGLRFYRNASGGVRVPLGDGNHIDVASTTSFGGAETVDAALHGFDFSVNAMALRLGAGEWIVHPATRDLELRKFRVLAPLRSARTSKCFQKMEALERVWNLTPDLEDLRTREAKEGIQTQRARYARLSAADAMRSASEAVSGLVPGGARAWIVRGYVRNAVLGELQYWDDVDVVVSCTRAALITHLQNVGASYSLNFHGSPKVVSDKGIMVDIWSMEGGSIEAEVGRYDIDSDAVAWSLEEGKIVESLYNRSGLAERSLSLRSVPADPSFQAYALLKATYLCLRHQLSPVGELTLEALGRDIDCCGQVQRQACRLATELACANVSKDAFARLKSCVGSSHSLELLSYRPGR